MKQLAKQIAERVENGADLIPSVAHAAAVTGHDLQKLLWEVNKLLNIQE